jgi:hypothetical protein
MIQVFRRDENAETAKNLVLRGLEPAASYEVTNLDTNMPQKISGKDLMERGARVEIISKRGSAIILYKKVR